MELVTADALSKRAEFSTAQFFELQSELSKRNEVRVCCLPSRRPSFLWVRLCLFSQSHQAEVFER